MSWEEVKKMLDELAALRGYKPVDEVIKNSGSVPLIPPAEPQPNRRRRGMWWNNEQ